MVKLVIVFLVFMLNACGHVRKMPFHKGNGLTGTRFYEMAAAMNWASRDSLVIREALAGNLPSFLRHFVAVRVSVKDSMTGKLMKAVFYVAPDYLSIGTQKDWARVCITPYAAQQIADSLQCFLPTRKMVDDIYQAATVKLRPVPLFAYRDSTPSMWQHHLIIEGQRKGKKGLIAGIKKDVVISGKISRDKKPDRVAIYGWHQPGGRVIQPLYTGHIYWWVDYSQGIRLVYRRIKVDGKWMDYTEVFRNPRLRGLLCDEKDCDFLRYPVHPNSERTRGTDLLF